MLRIVTYLIARKFSGVESVSTDAFRKCMDATNADSPLLIVDTRGKDEFALSRIKGAIHLPVDAKKEDVTDFLEENIKKGVPTKVVCYCAVGYRSSIMVEKINKIGLENVKAFNLEGSIFKWANEDKPLEGSEFVHPFSPMWGFFNLKSSKWNWEY